MTNEHLIALAATILLITSLLWWAFAYRNFREAKANEKLFFESVSRQLHNHTVIQLDQERRDEEREVELAKSRLGVRGEPTGLEGAPLAAKDTASRAREDCIRMERASQWIDDDIKAKNDRLRAALDLIPVKDARSIAAERKDYEARELIAKTDLATLEAAISEREQIPNIAPTMVANLEAAKARIAAAEATKAEAEARLAVAMAPRAPKTGID